MLPAPAATTPGIARARSRIEATVAFISVPLSLASPPGTKTRTLSTPSAV